MTRGFLHWRKCLRFFFRRGITEMTFGFAPRGNVIGRKRGSIAKTVRFLVGERWDQA